MKTGRRVTLVIIVILCFSLFTGNLFVAQIANNEKDNPAASSLTTVVKASRGEIYDRNGKLLVTNSQSSSIIFDNNYFPPQSNMEERIVIIKSLIDLFEKNGAEWNDNLPIRIKKNGEIVFKKDRDSDIAYLKSKDFLNLNDYATAENCLDALIERYSLESYSLDEAKKIASVCYGMKKEMFSSTTPYDFADDVTDELVSIIKENSDFYQGVDVQINTGRLYVKGSVAPHVIGVVGAISAEEYAEKKELGYGMNDDLGKTGIEKVMEEYLRGTDGEKVVIKDENGEKETVFTKEPEKGNAVFLTIDSDVQIAVQDALKELLTKTLAGTRSYKLAGACVVQEVATGEVLACASYPTYDLSTYWEHAGELNTNSEAPLWNRALQSIYTPGSTMKVAVSMAGLEEGIIKNSSYSVFCKRKYTYYTDYQPSCLSYHGSLNVVTALYHSCNYFFYEVSRLLGISKLNEYSTMFGLGQKTGVELYETEGHLDTVAYRESLGETWTAGLTLQAGIGHGNNQFTPIQMCSYVQTVANRGKRMKASLVKEVKTADLSKTVFKTEHEVLSQADFADKSWDLVKEGMKMVGDHYFTKACVKVAAKTGTTTVSRTVNGRKIETYNGLDICYAPADDPKIAVSVVIEGAGSGGSTAPVAVAAINAYFGENEDD